MNTTCSFTEVQTMLSPLFGKPCCRQRVGRSRSLSIGFGKKVSHLKDNKSDTYYGEWEIRTYSSAWRILKNNKIICGSLETVDSVEELDDKLQHLSLGAARGIELLEGANPRILLEEGEYIDFMYASSEEDEVFHISGPDNLYLEFTWPNLWVAGKSNVPWG